MLCASCRARAASALWASARTRTSTQTARSYARRTRALEPAPSRSRLQDYQPPPRAKKQNAEYNATNSSSESSQSTIREKKRQWNFMLLSGAVAGLVPAYLFFQYTTLVENAKRCAEKDEPVPQDTSFVYNWTAEQYDKDVDYAERWYTHVSKLRKKMCERAKGHVLESAVGTGRNTTAYPLIRGDIKSVTMVDKSKPMLDIARRKWPEEGNAWYINALFRVADLASPDPAATATVKPPIGSGKTHFDSVIQTMGVCSTGDPVQLLRNLGRLCEPTQGRIMLIEHGKSTYDWLNHLLDTGGPAHAERHGCWWNRDIGKIVRDSGLEILEEERFDLGTTWWYVLKVPEDKSKLLSEKERSAMTDGVNSLAAAAKPWWQVW